MVSMPNPTVIAVASALIDSRPKAAVPHRHLPPSRSHIDPIPQRRSLVLVTASHHDSRTERAGTSPLIATTAF
jgi:hypothetical protein